MKNLVEFLIEAKECSSCKGSDGEEKCEKCGKKKSECTCDKENKEDEE